MSGDNAVSAQMCLLGTSTTKYGATLFFSKQVFQYSVIKKTASTPFLLVGGTGGEAVESIVKNTVVGHGAWLESNSVGM